MSFLLVFHNKYQHVPILHRFLRYSEILVEYRYPTSILVQPLGWPRRNFAEIFGNRKHSVPGLSHGVVCMILRLAVLVQYWRVTNGWTDR